MAVRIQRRRVAGWRMPSTATYVGRPTKYGNPFSPGSTIGCPDHATAVELYRAWLEHGNTAPYPRPGETAQLEALRERVLADAPVELAGRDLACWCPLPTRGEADYCHAAVLLDLANRTDEHSTGAPR